MALNRVVIQKVILDDTCQSDTKAQTEIKSIFFVIIKSLTKQGKAPKTYLEKMSSMITSIKNSYPEKTMVYKRHKLFKQDRIVASTLENINKVNNNNR